MPTQQDSIIAADGLLDQARAASPALRGRAAMPPWFVDAPDGLDAAAKRRLFDDLRQQARKATGIGANLALLTPVGVALAYSGHWSGSTSAALAAVLVALLLALALARKPLLRRMLRLHVKRNASW
jgi:TRAP-type C4-dicarboxylate transport system permease large subunit